MKRTWAGILILLVLVAGCSQATSEGPQPQQASLRVENDILPPVAFSIFAVNTTGSRRLIGTVTPGETTTLQFDARGSADFTFVAEGPLNRQIVSPTMTIGAGDGAVWSLNNNVLTPM